MDIKEQLQKVIKAAAEAAAAEGIFAAGDLPPVHLEEPPQKEFGDYATNFAMQAARIVKSNPRVIAQAVIDRLQAPWLEKAELAGPGFINFYLKPDWLHALLANVLAAGEEHGASKSGAGEKVQIEFVSANPTGLLHVGHGRGAAVGSALANLFRVAGYDVQTEFYINDAGNQIDNLALSVDARYRELLGQSVEFPEDGYHGRDIVDTAQRIIDAEGDRYLQLPAEERVAAFKEIALKEKQDILKTDLEAFGVTFDHWFSERQLHRENAIEETCRQLQASGDIYEKDSALWLKSTAYGDDKDRVVIRDNGIPTYLAADIAYHRDKFRRGFERVINIWGADHHGYICRVKAAVAALGYAPERLEVLILQMVSLYQNGELVKMSKRTGQGVSLGELMEEVGRDAARFFFIMRSIDSQLDFDMDLAKSRSNDNPVYYIQYAHARISSIFRQAAEAGIPVLDYQALAREQNEDLLAALRTLQEEAEADLIKKIGQFTEEVALAAKERAPHRIARYVHELAGLFHTFYNQCRIIGADPATQTARLALVTAVRSTLRQALGILGVAAPEKM